MKLEIVIYPQTYFRNYSDIGTYNIEEIIKTKEGWLNVITVLKR